jgi:hypothetical protein
MFDKISLGLASICAFQIAAMGFASPAAAEYNLHDPHRTLTLDCSQEECTTTGGTTATFDSPEPRKIPEPGTVGALLLMGLGMVCYHGKRPLAKG